MLHPVFAVRGDPPPLGGCTGQPRVDVTVPSINANVTQAQLCLASRLVAHRSPASAAAPGAGPALHAPC